MSIAMQRIFARLLVVIMGLLAIFSGGNMDNIKLELKNEITTKTEIVEFQVLNYTGKKLVTDKYFSVEKNENGEWVKVDFVEDYSTEDIAIIINNLQTATLKIDIIKAFGKTFDEGEYRLLKAFGADTTCTLIFTVNAD